MYLTDDERTSEWESLAGERNPYSLLGRHPSGAYLAMQVRAPMSDSAGVSIERAGVWDAASRRLVWAPQGAITMSWLPAGDRILEINRSYQPLGDVGQRITRTAYQTDFTHQCRLYEWPSKHLLASCDLEFPTGWIVDVVASPTSDIAAYVWIDQTEAGFEFIAITDDRLSRIHAGRRR